MATSELCVLEAEQEVTEIGSDLDLNKITHEMDTEVNIAIVGKTGSGRSSFIKAIIGNTENQRGTTAREPAEPTSYSHPANPNVKFSILPNMDKTAFPAFQPYLKYAENYECDAFLIFTAEKFSKRHLLFAKRVMDKKKPIFFIRSKIDYNRHTDGCKKTSNEQDALYRGMRASLEDSLKKNQFCKSEIYLVSNHQPEKWDFEKLIKAIAGYLSFPQKENFWKLASKIQKFIVDQRFKNFFEETKPEETNVAESIISMDEIGELFGRSGIAGIQHTITKNLEQWKEVKINLAILGNSGAGKSSFINAVRGVHDNDDFAANTGVTETTMVPTSYQHPTNSNILFWDLPGIGTPEYPDMPIFCERVAIEKYDTFLIICSGRLTKNDLALAEKVREMGKSFFFIRTKIDNEVRNERRKLKGAFDETKMLQMIRNDCERNLQESNFGEENVFLISSRKPTKWDFDRLKKAILDQLPLKQKESLTMTLRTHSKELLREKIKILKDRLWYVSVVSVATKVSLGPISLFIDTKLIRNTVKLYCSQLAFPEDNSNEFKKLPRDLQEKVKRFHPKPDQEYLQWLKSFDPEDTYKLRMKMKMTISSKPFKFVHGLLILILDEMEEAALSIIEAGGRDDGEVDSEDEEVIANDQREVNLEDGEVNAQNGEVDAGKDGEVDTNDEKVDVKDKEANPKDEEVDVKDREVDVKAMEIDSKDGEVDAKDGEMDAKDGEVDSKDGEVDAKDGEVDAKDGEVDAKDGEVEAKDGEVNAEDGEVDAKDGEVEAGDGEVDAEDSKFGFIRRLFKK